MDMEAETSSTSSETSVDVTDQIAELLGGEEETETEDSVEEETLTDESTESEDSDEETSEEEETVDEDASEPEDESWASVLGVDEDKLDFDDAGNVSGVKVKINGETSSVNMNDLIAGYQTNKNVTQQSQKLAEDRRAFDASQKDVEDNYTSKLENVEMLSDYLGKQLTSQYDGVNWEQLRIEDPAEYAALRQDYATKAQDVQRAQEAIAQEKQQLNQANVQKQSEFQKQHIAQEFEKMVLNNPTWTDRAVLKTDMQDLRTFSANQYGFADNDFDNVTDSRLISVLQDAKAYREGVKVSQKKMKRPVPKFQKSKGGSVKKVSRLDKLTKRASSATGAQKRTFQTDAIAELLGAV